MDGFGVILGGVHYIIYIIKLISNLIKLIESYLGITEQVPNNYFNNKK